MPQKWSKQPPMLPYIMVGLILIVAFFGAQYGYTYYLQKPQGVVVYTTNSQGQIVTNTQAGTTVQVYSGAVSWTVPQLWAKDESTLTLTGTTIGLYHVDNSLAGAVTATAATWNVNPTDHGRMKLAILDKTQIIGWVDPALTVKKNPSWLLSWDISTDFDQNGQYDLTFEVTTQSITTVIAGLTPAAAINLYAWKQDTSGTSFTATVSPTGMTSAGDYHAQGYFGFTGEGYQATVTNLYLWVSHTNAANTTASSLSTKLTAGTVAIKAVRLSGYSNTGKLYGSSWGTNQANSMPIYDTTNTRWILFRSTHDGVVDPTQKQWGMPLVYEKNSGSAFLSYDVWVNCGTGALTASSVYYLYVEATVASLSTAVSDTSTGLKITLTG